MHDAPLCDRFAVSHHGQAGTMVVPLPCNRWTCKSCAEAKAARLRMLIADGRPNALLTLTVNPEVGASPDQRYQMLLVAFNNLTREVRRRFAKRRLEYVAAIEMTKRGEPHLHIAIRGPYIAQRWISAFMKREIKAPIVDIRPVERVRKLARYLTKYITKDLVRFNNGHRYLRSHGWLTSEAREARANRKSQIEWTFWAECAQAVVDRFTAMGHRAVHCADGSYFFPLAGGP